MMENSERDDKTQPVPYHEVEKATRLSYAQAMLSSVYAASTGGMFIIGYALALGANNVQIGLMSTIPMLAVVIQLVSSFLVERGFSRKRLTILASLLNVSCWVLVALLPVLMKDAPPGPRIGFLILALAAISGFAQLSGNARSSWIGDLIPADTRGLFFGKMIMYSGFVGMFFALAEGRFLDEVKKHGTSGFSWLFVFGMVFGLASSLLFVPQSDVHYAPDERRGSLWKPIKETFLNRPLMMMTAFGTVWSLQMIASPFYATYLLRDVGIPFLGVGVLNAAGALTILLSSPFWGRAVSRHGCRPVLTICSFAIAPTMLIWLLADTPAKTYIAVIPTNMLQGFLISGISVGLNTLLFNLTPSSGRSVQIAVYAIVVTLLAAPMPAIGGHLPDWLASLGINTDLRICFYITILPMIGSALIARKIQEKGAGEPADLLNHAREALRRRGQGPESDPQSNAGDRGLR